MKRILTAGLALAIGTTLVGCSSGTAGPVTAELKEFSINLGRTSASAGQVTFNVSNKGTIVHEFVVIDTDTSAASLPLAADGTVSEEGLTVVDEIEDIAIGATPALNVDLAAGHYVIICNISGHYAAGMHVDFQAQ